MDCIEPDHQDVQQHNTMALTLLICTSDHGSSITYVCGSRVESCRHTYHQHPYLTDCAYPSVDQ